MNNLIPPSADQSSDVCTSDGRAVPAVYMRTIYSSPDGGDHDVPGRTFEGEVIQNQSQLKGPEVPKDFSGQYFLEFGPMAEFERNVTRRLANMDDTFPGAAEIYVSAVRRGLHSAVAMSFEPGKVPTAVDRLRCLKTYKSEMQNHIRKSPEAILLSEAAKNAMENALEAALDNEVDRLTAADAFSDSPSLASSILGGLKAKLQAAYVPPDISVRENRNRQIASKLSQLSKFSSEMAANVGDANWERNEGVTMAAGVAKTLTEAKALMKDAWKYGDHMLFQNRLDGIKTEFSESNGKAATEELQTALKDSLAQMAEFLVKLFQSIGVRFSGSKPS